MNSHIYTPQQRGLSTNALADAIGAKPAAIRVRLCRTGSYFGLKPKRLPNGRLLWPAASVELLLGETEGAA